MLTAFMWFILFVLLKAQDARDVVMTSSVGLLGILGPVGSSAISLFLLFIILTDDDPDPDISIVYNPWQEPAYSAQDPKLSRDTHQITFLLT